MRLDEELAMDPYVDVEITEKGRVLSLAGLIDSKTTNAIYTPQFTPGTYDALREYLWWMI